MLGELLRARKMRLIEDWTRPNATPCGEYRGEGSIFQPRFKRERRHITSLVVDKTVDRQRVNRAVVRNLVGLKF